MVPIGKRFRAAPPREHPSACENVSNPATTNRFYMRKKICHRASALLTTALAFSADGRRLYVCNAAQNAVAVMAAEAGDIVGVIGPRSSITGDTLCDAAEPILLEQIQFPETVISMAIEPEKAERLPPVRKLKPSEPVSPMIGRTLS